jgi:anti-sigma factor RsiW
MIDHCPKDPILSAFMDRSLSRAALARVRDHLQACADCRRKLAALEHTEEMIRALPRIEPSDGFDGAFWKKVARYEEAHRRPSWLQRWIIGWKPALAAGLAAGLVAAFLVFHQAHRSPTAEEVFIAGHMEMLNDMELVQHLDLLENWEDIQEMKEQG